MEKIDIAEVLLDSIYGICVTAAGLYVLLRPYEKLKEAAPKAPSKSVVKTLGVLVTICGILLTILGVLGVF